MEAKTMKHIPLWVKAIQSKVRGPFIKLLPVILVCVLFAAPTALSAQDEEEGQVQVLSGRIFLDDANGHGLGDSVW